MERLTLVLLVNALLVTRVPAANILIYPFGHCFNSHLINFEKLGKILQQGGHNVTMLINSNYWDFLPIGAEGVSPVAGGQDRTAGMELLMFTAPNDFVPICDYGSMNYMLYTPISDRFSTFIMTASRYCENILSDQPLLRRLKEAKYDLFILEALDPCSRILADYIDVKFVPFMTTGLGHLWDGNPRPPSYVPAAIGPFTPQMSFTQRIGNFIMKAMYEAIPVLAGFDTAFEALKMKYQLNTSLSLAHTMHRASLKLVNSDFAIEYPSPIEPDTILVGGFAIPQPQPLSGQIRDYVEGAHHGVIVFSFGTLVKNFEDPWKDLFVSAFSLLKQKVIWRAEGMATNDTEMENGVMLADNVLVFPWLPQADILAHSNTRLLITHCGLNSAMEAASFGVPIIALPMSGDHFNQASKLTDHAGMGITLDINSLTSEVLSSAIQDILNDPSYKDNAQTLARRIADQPMSKPQTINYWVNYVLRHSGDHLKSMAHKLTWYQYFSLDVIVTLLIVLAAALCLILGLLSIVAHYVWKHLDIQRIWSPKQKVK